MIGNRIAYGKAVHDMALKNNNIVVVDADCIGPLNYSEFVKDFPDRFVECGIAEQNMVSIAAGIASCGKTVFVGSFAVFSTMRALDQVRNQICYNNFDVKVIGTHAGVETGFDGATHQAIEDMAIMRAIPNMRVLAPSTPIMTEKLTYIMGNTYGPFYMRFGKNPNNELYEETEEFKIGKSKRLREGNDITIMACGRMVERAIEAADMLKGEEGIKARVCDMYSIKPIDTEEIDAAVQDTHIIITVEDHSIIGGLGSAVCEYIADKSYYCKVFRHGIEDHFGRSGDSESLFLLYGLTADGIARKAKKCLNKIK
jgi:transketolase